LTILPAPVLTLAVVAATNGPHNTAQKRPRRERGALMRYPNVLYPFGHESHIRRSRSRPDRPRPPKIVPGGGPGRAPRPQDSTVVELSCIEDDAQGQELDVLWERELDAAILTGEEWARIAQRGFDPPEYFSAYLNTLRWNCVTSTDASLLQSPFRAGIRLDAYQLEPLRKALRLPRVNLFIADDVGLGKTIEAGLIARELLMRKKVREIVVACPPSMLLQWQEELEQRFGLLFEILDKDFIARIRRERGFGVNPWTAHSRFLISHRLLIDEAYAGPLRNWLGTFRPGTLLILDEAHHAAPSSGQRYAIDSQITRAIQGLSPRFEHRLFLSATPHNGHSNSFTALLELLDPQRFCRGVKVVKRNLDDVMVRRLKDDCVRSLADFRSAMSCRWIFRVCRPTRPNFVSPPCSTNTAPSRGALAGETGARRALPAC
jgi:hypothetical protein